VLTVSRVVARVIGIVPQDWRAAAGDRFRSTLRIFSQVVHHTLPAEADAPSILSEGAKRVAVGMVSRDHAEAMRNYAEEEKIRIDIAYQKRTEDDRARTARAVADQEETKARLLNIEEIQARLTLAETLEQLGVTLAIQPDGRVHVFRPESLKLFEKIREDLLVDADALTAEILAPSDGRDPEP
jgi:hypothetical protein